MPVKVTTQVLLGRKSHGCPTVVCRSGRRDLGGEQTRRPERKEWRRSRNTLRCGVSQRIDAGKPTYWRDVGKADDVGEETGMCTQQPAGIMAQASWDRLAEERREGPSPSRGWQQPAKTTGISGRHEILVEGGGLAHEPVGAMTKG